MGKIIYRYIYRKTVNLQ